MTDTNAASTPATRSISTLEVDMPAGAPAARIDRTYHLCGEMTPTCPASFAPLPATSAGTFSRNLLKGIAAFVRADLASGFDEARRLLGVVGRRLGLARHC